MAMDQVEACKLMRRSRRGGKRLLQESIVRKEKEEDEERERERNSSGHGVELGD